MPTRGGRSRSPSSCQKVSVSTTTKEVNGRKVETRVEVRDGGGGWAGASGRIDPTRSFRMASYVHFYIYIYKACLCFLLGECKGGFPQKVNKACIFWCADFSH